MSAEEKARQSALVTEKVVGSAVFAKSRRIGIYLSLEREVDTSHVIAKSFTENKRIFVPKFETNFGRKMDFFEVFSVEDVMSLTETKWRIKQPADESRPEALSSGGLDLMIVPLVAFTADGLRLGNGFGFYDKYLLRCLQNKEEKPYLMGIGFREQMVDTMVVEEHDIRMDSIIFS